MDADALFNRAHSLAGEGRLDEAIACLRTLLEAEPRDVDALSNLGVLLVERGEHAAGEEAYRRALALRPDHAEALNNLGALLEELGRRREAMDLYRRGLEANPAAARIAYNLGLAHLRELEFEKGWRLCEARYHTSPPVTRPPMVSMPELSAADLGKGLRTAVWREQGLGDQILYSTLLPELEARGERFVLDADPRLLPAFKRAHPAWHVTSERDFKDCQRHVAIGSLPKLLRPSAASFASQPKALLAADPARTAEYKKLLEARGRRLIGISWRSFQAMRTALRMKKSAPLAMFLALSQRADVKLVDLQYGDTAAERAAFADAGGVLARIEGLDLFIDVEGVLGAVAACDAVVTTSNVTAHFAGALGKPAWVVYAGSSPPFYYWTAGEDGRSLWYPSVQPVALASWDAFPSRMQALPI